MKLNLAPLIICTISVCFISSCAEIKDSGRAVGHATRDITKTIGHEVRDTTKEIGHNVKKAVKKVGSDDSSSSE